MPFPRLKIFDLSAWKDGRYGSMISVHLKILVWFKATCPLIPGVKDIFMFILYEKHLMRYIISRSFWYPEKFFLYLKKNEWWFGCFEGFIFVNYDIGNLLLKDEEHRIFRLNGYLYIFSVFIKKKFLVKFLVFSVK